VGYSAPSEYGALIGRIVKALGDCAIVSVHCHDDLGLAVANSLAAVEAGARQIECTINGIGERAGNCSLEEVVMVMKTRNDLYPYSTGIHTEHLSRPAKC
jgi:2-isopropylmalate synthase